MNKVKRGPVDCANNVVRAEADIFSLTSSFVRNGWQKKGKCDDGSDLTSFNIYTSVPRPAKTLMDIRGCRHSGFGRSGFGVRGLDVRGLDVRGSV